MSTHAGRPQRRRIRGTAALLAGLAMLPVAACVPDVVTPPPTKPYTIVELTTAGAESARVTSISPDGSIIGGYAVKRIGGNPVLVGAVWRSASDRQDVLPAAGLSAGITSVDDDGAAVGWTTDLAESDWPTRPAVLEHGEWRILPGVGEPTPFGSATATRGGRTVGTGVDPDETISAPWLDAGGITAPLGSFGGQSGAATDVNASGTAVGWSQLAGSEWRSEGFVVPAGQTLATATRIEGLGGATTFVRGINDHGVVLGDGSNGAGSSNAFLWTPSGGAVEIVTPPPGISYVVARSINNSNQVVGDGPATASGSEAWLWDQAGGKRLLDTLVTLPDGWRIRYGLGIADDGSIAAEASDATGAIHPIVLRPSVGAPTTTAVTSTTTSTTVAPETVTVTDDQHLDLLSINVGPDDSLRLGIDHADHPELLDPATTIVRVRSSSRGVIGSNPLFAPLGDTGSDVWNLDGGWTVRGADPGQFVGDTLAIELQSVSGPGALGVWKSNSFGDPGFDLASSSPVPQSIVVSRTAHAHRNWSFTAPGTYHVTFEVTAISAATGVAVSSGTETLTFQVDA